MKKQVRTKRAPKTAPRKKAVKKQPPKEAATPKREGTKQDLVLSLLRRETGAELTEMMTATGWQAHSVRGFLSGTVKKKLGLTVTREGTTYRISQ